MKALRTLLLTAIAVFVGHARVQGGIINGGFETGNLNGWTLLGSGSASSGQSYGASGIVTSDSGAYSAQISTLGVSAATVAAQMGLSEAQLEASNSGVDATTGSLLYQSVNANAGDLFVFRWNFVEQDYVPYDDWAFYGISFGGGPASLTKFASLATVGPIQGVPANNTTIAGWTTLSVNITQTGSYTFYFGIVNAVDSNLDSQLWLDGIEAAPEESMVPEPSSAALFCLGLSGWGIYRRRKQRS